MKANGPIHTQLLVRKKTAISIYYFLGFLIWGGYILSRPITEAGLTKLTNSLFHIPFFESPYLYIYHHLLALGPVLISMLIYPFFGPRFFFYKKWLTPILLGSIPFIVWDILFSKSGIWGFNSIYILGIELYSFPIEEILWFPVIGICSLFVYELLTHRQLSPNPDSFKSWLWITILTSIVISAFYHERIYTAFSSWSVGFMALMYWQYGLSGLFARVFRSFIILIIPMFLFDGLLTGMFTKEGLVIYNLEECTGLRVVSIPVEDFLFGFSFIMLIIFIQNRIANHWKQL